MLVAILLFLAGILILYFGAEWLVRGSSSLALHFGVPPVVVGLTIVAMGTSAPELVASLQAQITANAGNIVVGNVIGSNIYNVGLVLGLAALFTPIEVHSDIVRREAPLAIGVSILLLLLMIGGVLLRWEGILLLICFLGYLSFQFHITKKGRTKDSLVRELTEELKPVPKQRVWWMGLLIVGGIIGLVVGAKLLVDNAIFLAETWGISQRIIGLTLVAFGTSLPELATTLVAALKKERDIAVANVVGSNIFNILLIIGATALVRPIYFEPQLLTRDGLFMLAIIVLMMLMVIRRRQLVRWQGALLILAVVAYNFLLF